MGEKAGESRFFHFCGHEGQRMAPLRTRIYIDGFNFYYGLLKGGGQAGFLVSAAGPSGGMIVRAKPVLGSRSKIMKWANLPNPWMAGHKPIELIETEAGAASVFAYIDNYIQSFSVGVAEP